MKKKNNNSLFWIIGGIILIIIAGFGIYKLVGEKKSSSGSDKPNSPSKNPSLTPLNKLSDQELEKCLLEDFSRRLDLEKYFVFNLGELQTKSPMVGEIEVNWRITNNRLDNDLTKLTIECQKHLEKQGYKRKRNPLCKNSVYFFRDRNAGITTYNNDFVRDLDKKITNGNWYIIFDKEKNYDWPLGWFTIETDSNGQKWLLQTPSFQLRLKNPSTTICDSKEKALEFLKNNDTALKKN